MPLVLSGTDGVSGVDGTASNPAIEGTDSNTGIFYPAADTVAIGTGGTERLRVDSAGNAGLGVTPSAWNSSYKSLDINTRGFGIAGASDAGTISINSFLDSGSSWRYKGTSSFRVTRYDQFDGSHFWFNAPSGTAGNAITFTQAMTLDSAGWLGLGSGASSPAAPLHISNAQNEIMRLQSSDNVTGNVYLSFYNSASSRKGYIGYGSSADDSLQFYNDANSYMNFATNGTERARITSGGYLKVSNNGTYINTGGNYNEINQSANTVGLITFCTDGSFTSRVHDAYANRSANSAYSFFHAYSNYTTAGDLEFNLRGDGNGYADGTWNNNGADYAEFFESATGAALTLGATVVLDGNKVREATDQDPASAIMGVVRPKEPSKASMVVGNTAWNKWANKYLTDDFDRYIMEDHDVFEWTDEDGKQHSYESHNIPAGVTVPDDAVIKTHDDKGNKFQHYKLNPAWNPDAEYVNRENRPEWIIVGLVGQVKILKGQPVNDRWIKMRDVSATVEEWMIR